jgi:4-hydroxybenzoate polyprenyltransferase
MADSEAADRGSFAPIGPVDRAPQSAGSSARGNVPGLVLCVDLDGTLVRTDTFWESVRTLLYEHPRYILWLPVWLLRGRAFASRRMADIVSVDPDQLPYREELLSFLRSEHASGRVIALTAASDARLAASVANFLGIFREVLANDGDRELLGQVRLEAIQERFGEDFDYAGKSGRDLPLWKVCRRAYLVAPSPRLLRRVSNVVGSTQVFAERPTDWRALVRALRPHQWIKNLLVFVPLVLAHELAHAQKVSTAIVAFVCFGLCASAGYVINDLLDLSADRQHPVKRHRPLASGAVPLPAGAAIAFALAVAGLAGSIAVGLSRTFLGFLACYLGLTICYSVYVKRKLLLDVLLLAGLYTLRILAGGEAVQVPVSTWLGAFSMFMFLSLAFVKRYTELKLVLSTGGRAARGRNYRVEELDLIASCGTASGFLAVLVMALYITSDEVERHYSSTGALWLICPILLYWVLRIWFLARRGEVEGDPVAFAVRDRNSILVGTLTLLLFVLASR